MWGTLERNKLRTLDEDLHLQKTRDRVKNQKLPSSQNIQMAEDSPDYQMKADDLFELSEHMPLQGRTCANERA